MRLNKAEATHNKRTLNMLTRAIAIAVFSTVLAQGAFAQSANSNNSSSTATTTQNNKDIPQQIRQKLKNDGFTNVQIAPGSYLVQAKDKSGDPVLMVIGPHSMTMLTEVQSNSSSTTGSSNKDQSNSGSNAK